MIYAQEFEFGEACSARQEQDQDACREIEHMSRGLYLLTTPNSALSTVSNLDFRINLTCLAGVRVLLGLAISHCGRGPSSASRHKMTTIPAVSMRAMASSVDASIQSSNCNRGSRHTWYIHSSLLDRGWNGDVKPPMPRTLLDAMKSGLTARSLLDNSY